MDDPSMDEFAQTRGADDLFDDEIIPVTAEEQVQTQVVDPEPEPEPESEPVQSVRESPAPEKQASPRGEPSQRARGDKGRGRGRGKGKAGGRGGAGGTGGGLSESRWADPQKSEGAPQSKGSTPATGSEIAAEEQVAMPEKREEGKPAASEEEDKSEVSGANGAEAARVPAVRGDRSATGGVRKPKLTEEELSKRIASAKENAAKKAAAHARAEADQASFLEREQAAAQKRREELANRKVMDNEREKNRQRKLKAQTGREWDSEKREEDYNPRGGGSQFRRGMHGGVSGFARRDFDEGNPEESATHLSPGRGRGRGGRGGRGRGPSRGPRGDRSPSKGPSEKADRKPAVNNDAEFPSLPPGKPLEESEKPTAPKVVPPTMESLESTFSPVSGTWADQVGDE
ncbi:hypothetical protein N7468_007321 [Penicillium chermesinum]|uniref:Uncharacterized protein n=1 Tax=Penicillium chermesinum TaxID=63820 RepID=A0A9W9NTV3_9EURO|nr:uncharacterized protein N7468_007321 [Penicillium chermesinum]KAJ5226096.1 hypothetical protein N7468_007321 [Penicillium chermesinum]